jgi:hypothetical protein
MPTSVPEAVLAKPSRKTGRPRKEDKQPFIRAEIVRAYGATGSIRQTAKALGLGKTTVRQVFQRNPGDFATAEKLHASNLLADADTCRALSMQPERLAECSSPQLAVMAGIYTQRAGEVLASPASKMMAVSESVRPPKAETPTLADAVGLLVSGHSKLVVTRTTTTEKVELSTTESPQPVKAEPSKPPEGEQKR